MEKRNKHIVVIGPESSGKTTLCKGLATHYNVSFTEEYARKYLEIHGADYNLEDLLQIAKGQLLLEQSNKNEFAIHDTDLITIKIWSEFKYQFYDPWIGTQIEKQKTQDRFYLLCNADIPWEKDPLREHPFEREEIFKIHVRELEKMNANYAIIQGNNRLPLALSKIQTFCT